MHPRTSAAHAQHVTQKPFQFCAHTAISHRRQLIIIIIIITHRRQFIFPLRLLQILHSRLWVRVPQVLKFLHLQHHNQTTTTHITIIHTTYHFLRHVTRSPSLSVSGLLHKPRQQSFAAVDEGYPLRGVPVVLAKVGGVAGKNKTEFQLCC